MMRPVLHRRDSRLTLRASPRFDAGVTELTARPANCATITSRKLGAPANEPMPRKLHALWTEIFLGKRKPDDSAITALGPAAVSATNEMIKELRKAEKK